MTLRHRPRVFISTEVVAKPGQLLGQAFNVFRCGWVIANSRGKAVTECIVSRTQFASQSPWSGTEGGITLVSCKSTV